MHERNQCDHAGVHNDRRVLARGYAELVRSRIDLGWSPSLLTFMFRPLPGSAPAVAQQMRLAIERVFARLITRVVRRPRSSTAQGRLPILLAFPDRPTFKRDRPRFVDVAVNDGAHVHGVLLLPPASRLRLAAHEHFQEDQPAYLMRSKLDRIHVRPIESNADFVVDYAIKAVTAGRVDRDDVIVLPKSISELPTR